MDITKQTSTQLVLQENNYSFISRFLFFWFACFGGIPLVISYFFAATIGVSTLACHRVKFTRIDCQQTHSKYFDKVQEPAIYINQLLGVQVDTETRTDSEGDDYKVYQVTLLSQSGIIPFIKYSRGYGEKQAIAQRIQSFINSKDPSFSIQQDRRWSMETLFFLIFIISYFIVILPKLFKMLQLETLILEKNTKHLTRRTQNLLGVKTEQQIFDKIAGIDLKEDTDSDGDKSYDVTLVFASGKDCIVTRRSNEQEAKAMTEQIREFLQLPASQPKELNESSKIIPKERVIFEGKKSIYRTTDMQTLPTTELGGILDADRRLTALSFQLLGDIIVSQYGTIVIYAYAKPGGDTYASLMKAGSNFAIDFYTTFGSGASLTTTTVKLQIKNFKSQKIFRNSYQNFEISELYSKHRQYVNELAEQQGSPRRTHCDLPSIAMAIDDFLVRKPPSFLEMLGMDFRQLWSLVFNRNGC